LLLFFIALAAVAGDVGSPRLVRLVLEQLGYGVMVGAVIGVTGGWLLGSAARHDWISPSFTQIGVAALPVLCLLASEALDASMFIAAFVAGLAVQLGSKGTRKPYLEFGEIWGQVLNLSVFTLFGAVLARNWDRIDLAIAAYAVASLTVVRMLPVAISLIGSGLSWSTLWFLGWFGPRGLASVVLGLVYLRREIGLPGESTIELATIATVALSILAHGMTARPAIAFYAGRNAHVEKGASG
jgi:NhaP-type Na+/H+ or K+/H+ antiporter